MEGNAMSDNQTALPATAWMSSKIELPPKICEIRGYPGYYAVDFGRFSVHVDKKEWRAINTAVETAFYQPIQNTINHVEATL
jgi:hypothetical protein